VVAVVPALVFNLFYFHFAVGSRHGEHTKEQYKDPLWHKRSVPAKLAEVKATNPRLIQEQAEFFGEANAKSTSQRLIATSEFAAAFVCS
jgi:hypothetical protein